MEAKAIPPLLTLNSPAGALTYQDIGDGRPVILIHGGGPGAYGWSNYRRNAWELAEHGHRVLVVDLPGYGGSATRPVSEGMYRTNALAILELMDHLNIASANFVGNSLGGGTALRLTLDAPDRVRRLVLMGPAGGLPVLATAPSEGITRMLDFYEGEGPTIEKLDRVIDLLVYDRSTITPELVAERFKTATLPQTLANPPLRNRGKSPRDALWKEGVETIQNKTLIIWGQEDRVLPFDHGLVYLKLIPNADLHIFSKCGHWAQWERAQEFNTLVHNFLAED